MRMFNPPHPGETLREDVFPALNLKVSEAADRMGVARPTLSKVLNGRAAISPEMALRIEDLLGVENGGSADFWLRQQSAYDLWQARQKYTKATPAKKAPRKAAVKDHAHPKARAKEGRQAASSRKQAEKR